MKKIYYYPLFIFLIVFLADKIACIPVLLESGRRHYKAGQNILLGINPVWTADKIKQETGSTTVSVFGSSRSYLFHEWKEIPLKENYFSKPIAIETRSIVKASDFLLNYLLIRSMGKVGYKPNLVVLEFSEEMLNEKSPFTFKSKSEELILNSDELISLFPYLEGEGKRNVLFKILFPSYNYHFQPLLAISNISKGKKIEEETLFVEMIAIMNEKQPFDPKNVGFPLNSFSPQDYQARIIDYTNQLIQNDILRNYSYSSNEEGVFHATIDYLEKNNIPTVIWEPTVHPYFLEKRKQITGGNHFQKLKEKYISKASGNVRTLSFVEDPLKCDIYVDASHVSPVCIPEMADRIFSVAKTIPNFKN
ncbi:hypothetical protein LPTSP3_g03250 [Leptospira kobayashii]|uniref:Lipoprotein n=1 Tax=Leptospira kobayashii TaxID=1917830 RepID=A0ABN6KA33_9LEPT|nr:DUF1574 family protein [Leptospira kobayashii]BDA77395.1 hypothetical protein LPTSP3_g03250 [Leptospira kobayashii]